MCKISTENNKSGTGFFYEFENFEIKYGLFTNYHVLTEDEIKIGKIVHFYYLFKHKK